MDFNKWWIAGVILVLAVVVVWMLWRNNIDRKAFEKDSNATDPGNQKHDGPST